MIDPLSSFKFKNRILSLRLPRKDKFAPVLSASEIADIFHFPYKDKAEIENIVKSYFKELPSPLSLKQGDNLDVIFAKNIYGGVVTPIGLTKLDRTGHMHVTGQTRSGKSNMILEMIKQDLEAGRCVIVIDPHGDLVKAAINFIPEGRINDFIYVQPRNIKQPVGINLLELSKTSDEDEKELEKDIVAEGTISILRKVFANEFAKGGTVAYKIEALLRNVIHTAFLMDDPTLFSIFDLLNNPEIRGQALQRITDYRLMDFWRSEFGIAGDYQQVKMKSPVNARVGRFLFSPILKRIMEQKKSTFDFSDLIENQKILFVNLAKGEISEDNCEVLGTVIITKIRQAAEKRALMDPKDRKPIYLYIDEFQNFATPSFMTMLSELGKFGVNIIAVEQSFAQQPDPRQTNIMLTNVGNIVTFKTAGPHDEDLMLSQFSPYIEKGMIANLPRYHFYMKKGAVDPEAPFSGVTEKVEVKVDKDKVERFIRASIKNYARTYQKPAEATAVINRTNKNSNINHVPNGNGVKQIKPKDDGSIGFKKKLKEKIQVTKKPNYLT